MTDPSDGGGRRSRVAAAALPSHQGETATLSRLTRVAAVVLVVAALAAIGAVGFAIATVADPAAVRWGTGAILVVLLVATGVLCAHAGGHAWFVPLPALALAAIWAITASARSAQAAWWLVALCAVACAGGVLVAGAALRQRLRGTLVGLPELRGTSGVAVTALAPAGIVRVAGENWSARSVSGALPAGAPVHVLGVRGVRLDVWSELGTVPDHTMIAIEEDKP
jgi:membrane-bound ClpP family serine protease